MMDQQVITTLISSLSPKLSVEDDEEIKALRELRSLIQSQPESVDLLAKQGMIDILVSKMVLTSDSNQLTLLQILASLGYLVQRSDERSSVAVKAGLFAAILEKVGRPNTSEGVLLLAIQVVTFIVEGSAERLEVFYTNNGIQVCLDILERGLVKCSLLNARLSTLLVQFTAQFPQELGRVSKHLYSSINSLSSRILLLIETNDTDQERVLQELHSLENKCVTFSQSLGLLLDSTKHIAASIGDDHFVKLFLKMFSNASSLSGFLIETLCWTLTYLLVPCPHIAETIQKNDGTSILSSLLKIPDAEDSLLNAIASVMYYFIHGLNPIDKNATCDIMLLEPIHQIELRIASSNNDLTNRHSMSSLRRTLKVLRRIVRFGGQCLDFIVASDRLDSLMKMIRNPVNYPSFVVVDVLQEIGLLVESSCALGLALAQRGVLNCIRDAVYPDASTQQMCYATRALACFVERSDDIGYQITDIALEQECDAYLITLLSSYNKQNIDEEVLLNTVGALGYMIKRHSMLHELNHQDVDRYNNMHGNACIVLVQLLGRSIGESLTWNALWALIYLINGPCSHHCTSVVLSQPHSLSYLAALIENNPENTPLVSSTSKALYHLVSSSSTLDVKTALSLEVRLQMLACMTRSSGTPRDDALDVFIDPSNMLASSSKVLNSLSGDDLGGKVLRVHYVSEQGEQAGIDAGGIRRDWLSRLSAELFSPSFSLVIPGYFPNDSVQISPNPGFKGMPEQEQHKWYRIMGRVLGLSVLHGDPVGVALVPSLSKLLLEELPDFEDIKFISTQYYKTIYRLKELRQTDTEQFNLALDDLTFTVNSRECMMKEACERSDFFQMEPSLTPSQSPCKHATRLKLEKVTTMDELLHVVNDARLTGDRDLIRSALVMQNRLLVRQRRGSFPPPAPKMKRKFIELQHIDTSINQKDLKLKRMMSNLTAGGETEKIDAGNFDNYIELLTHKLLVENVATQMTMLKQGFHDIIPRESAIMLLRSTELTKIVEGDRNVSVELWRSHCRYKGGNSNTPHITWFWEYVESLTKSERQSLLLWATGWRSIGSTGFSNRPFTIELTNVETNTDDERLPSVATCGFHLWLPKYSTKQRMTDKFSVAIRETSFGNC